MFISHNFDYFHNRVQQSQNSEIKSQLCVFFQGRNTTAPLVFVVCPDQIKLIPDFANISNEKKKAEDEEQTDVGVKDRNACGRSPWKHYEAESLSIVLVHVIILKAFSWQLLRLNIHHNNSPKTVPQLQKRNR